MITSSIRHYRLVSFAFLLSSLLAWGAETKPDTPASTKNESKAGEEEPVLSITAHTIKVGGKTLKYHATAGYLILKEEEGKPLVKNEREPPPPPPSKEEPALSR